MYTENENYPEILNKYVKYLYGAESPTCTINTYTGHIVEFLKFLKFNRKTKKDNTIDICKIKIDKMTNHEIKKTTLDEIDDYKIYLKDVKKLSVESRINKLAALNSFYEYCTTKGITDENIMKNVKRPKQKKGCNIIEEEDYLEEQEVKQLLKAIKNSDNKYKLRDYAITTIFLNCALRYSELVKITIDEIKELTENISINGKGNKIRNVYFNSACINAIKEYLPLREEMINRECVKEKDLLFISERGTKISNKQINNILKEYGKQAGIKKEVHCHMLRHTYATLAYNRGELDLYELQKILGHKNITTVTIYATVKQNKVKTAMNRFELTDE